MVRTSIIEKIPSDTLKSYLYRGLRKAKAYICDLEEFSINNAVWDPTLVQHKDNWYLYLLGTDPNNGHGSFFARENYIRCFKSKNLKCWIDLGEISLAGVKGKPFCAGNAISDGERIHYFGSIVVEDGGEQYRDERVYYANSIDGINFMVDKEFVLEPDGALIESAMVHPENGKILYGWRDPFPFYDQKTGKYYLYICTGGNRWGVQPQVAVAISNRLNGPYKLLGPTVDVSMGKIKDNNPKVQEIERVQVMYRSDVYYMLFSTWEGNINRKWASCLRKEGNIVTDASIHLLKADSPLGPFEYDDETPILQGSGHTGLYGSMLAQDTPGNAMFLIGWYPGRFDVEVSGSIKASWQRGNLKIDFTA